MLGRLGFRCCKLKIPWAWGCCFLAKVFYRLELARRVGNEPPLVGLIRVYKDYYPDVIVGETTAGRASVFTVLGLYLSILEGCFGTNEHSIRILSGARDCLRFRPPMPLGLRMDGLSSSTRSKWSDGESMESSAAKFR